MDNLIQRLKALSSAEDFLRFFGVPFEESVVHVNRLHILKRFYQYLHRSESLAELGEVRVGGGGHAVADPRARFGSCSQE